MVHIRCCGTDTSSSDIEKAVNLQYFKMNIFFVITGKNATKNTTDIKQKKYITDLIENLSKRWNGYDTGFTFDRPTTEPKTIDSDEKKFKTEIVKVFQSMPESIAHIKAEIVAIPRPFMNSYSGISNLSDEAHTLGWGGDPDCLVAAHEFGHANGLLDDYPEVACHASYATPGFRGLTPGDPYSLHDKTMMYTAKDLQHRDFWHAAEWLYRIYGWPFQLTHITKTYKIDHNPVNSPSNSKNHEGIRTYVQMPRAVTIDAGFKPSGSTPVYARYDSYLYELGEEYYNTNLLVPKTKSKTSATRCDPFDALLCININCKIEYIDIDDFMIIYNCAEKFKELAELWNYQWCCKIGSGNDCEGNSRQLNRCLIHLMPKQLILPFSEFPWYVDAVDVKSKNEYDDKVTKIEEHFPPHLVFKISESLSEGDSVGDRKRGIDDSESPPVCYETYRKKTFQFAQKLYSVALGADKSGALFEGSNVKGIIKVTKFMQELLSEIQTKVESENTFTGQKNVVDQIFNEIKDITNAGIIKSKETSVTDQLILNAAQAQQKESYGNYVLEILKLCIPDLSLLSRHNTNRSIFLKVIQNITKMTCDLIKGEITKQEGEKTNGEDAVNKAELKKNSGGSAADVKNVIPRITPMYIKIAAHIAEKPDGATADQVFKAIKNAHDSMTLKKRCEKVTRLAKILDFVALDIYRAANNVYIKNSSCTRKNVIDGIKGEAGYDFKHNSWFDIDALYEKRMTKYLSEWLGFVHDGKKKEDYEKFAESIHDGTITLEVIKAAN